MLNKNINGKIKRATDFEDLTLTPNANTIFPLTSLAMHVCLYIDGAIFWQSIISIVIITYDHLSINAVLKVHNVTW